MSRFTEALYGTGETVTLPAPYAVDGGAGALIGDLFGVAKAKLASGEEGAFQISGECNLPKVSAQAWVQLDKIYWDNTNKVCSNVSTVGRFIGVATAAAANPSSLGQVRLNGISAPGVAGVQAGSPTPTSKATAGAVTLTAAEVLSGIYVRDCAGAARSDTLPTAALLVAAVPGAKVGDVVKLKIVNGSDAAETLTILVGTGGAFDANQTAASQVIPQNTSKDLLLRLTNVTAASEAYVAYL
jgi:predicted RecA/RadA family phage recombinase